MKRFLAVILCVVVIFAVFVPVSAADGDDVDLMASYSPAEIISMFPEASRHLAEEIRALNKDISFEGYNIDVRFIDSIYKAVFSENPDIFYVSPSAFETTSSLTTGKMVSLRPYYLYETDKIPEKIAEFEEAADYFLLGVNPNWDDFNKARYLHDIVAHYVEYETKDYSSPSIYTAYGAMVNNRAVCEGYTLAYNYLLSRVGIESHYIQNKNASHAWAMIKLDGDWYHVDVTQDDATYDNLGRVDHTYCIVSDTALRHGEDDLDHAAWVCGRKAGNTKYDNSWWRTVNTMIYKIGASDYFVNQHYGSSVYAGVVGRNTATAQRKVGAVLETRWYVKDVPGAFWERAYTYITFDGKYLFFNDANKVYRQLPGSDVRFTVYTKPKNETNDIYGIAFKPDGYLYITIKENPSSVDKIYKLDIRAYNEYDFTETDPVQPEPTETVSETESETYPMAPTDTAQPGTEPSVTPTEPPAETDPYDYPVQIVKKKLTLYVAQKVTVTSTAEGKVTYSTNKKSVATVTKKGVITAKKAGKAVITAAGKYLTAKITVTVKNPKLSVKSVKIKKGKSAKIKIIGCTGKFSYKSSNKKIVTVKSNGKLVARKKGKATITVTTNGGIKLKCKITVV